MTGMLVLDLDPGLGLGQVQEPVESLHLVCTSCHEEDPECATLCGLLDEPEVENKDYQNCVVCFTILDGNVCAKGHVLRL